MIKIKNEMIDDLVESARNSPRRRMNLNVHKSLDEKIHRFFNAMEPDTYVRPHRHEDERFELFLCIRGEGAAVTFDDHGNITDVAILSLERECVGIEIPPKTWHTIISLSSGTVFFEVKEGPYRAISDKDFAPWAPEPENPDAAIYLDRIRGKVVSSAKELTLR